jgi:hypothetical protein
MYFTINFALVGSVHLLEFPLNIIDAFRLVLLAWITGTNGLIYCSVSFCNYAQQTFVFGKANGQRGTLNFLSENVLFVEKY